MSTVSEQHAARVREDHIYWRAAHLLRERAQNFVHSDNVALTKPGAKLVTSVEVVLDYAKEDSGLIKDLMALFPQAVIGERSTETKLRRLNSIMRELDPSLTVNLKHKLGVPESSAWRLVVSWELDPSLLQNL